MDKRRPLLHDFGLTYRIENCEVRKADTNKLIAALNALDLTEGEIEEVMIDTLGGVETLKGVFRPLGLAKAIIAARDRKRGGE